MEINVMKKNWIVGGTVVIALLFVGAWAFGYVENNYSDDPQVAEVEKLRDEKFSEPEAMNDDQMRAAGEQLKKQAAGLSSEQKKSLWESSMPIFMPMMMKRAEQEMDRFLALSPEEQRREMDKKIAQGRGGWQGRGGGKGKKPSAEKASEFMKKLNDYTTPEQRAKFDLVMGMYKDRKEQQGL